MTTKVEYALNRLTKILPLKAKQEECAPQIKELHQQILRSFVSKGRILTKEEMAGYVSDLEQATNILKNNDMVVFADNGDAIGAYPLTMDEREHKVNVNGHLVHAMCALDALAVSPMFGMKTLISSKCRVTGDPLTIEQSDTTIENADEASDLRFGIIWGAENGSSCVADSLCMEMMFLKNGEVADKWLAEDPDNRETFTLQEAVEFSARFFVPLMS